MRNILLRRRLILLLIMRRRLRLHSMEAIRMRAKLFSTIRMLLPTIRARQMLLRIIRTMRTLLRIMRTMRTLLRITHTTRTQLRTIRALQMRCVLSILPLLCLPAWPARWKEPCWKLRLQCEGIELEKCLFFKRKKKNVVDLLVRINLVRTWWLDDVWFWKFSVLRTSSALQRAATSSSSTKLKRGDEAKWKKPYLFI